MDKPRGGPLAQIRGAKADHSHIHDAGRLPRLRKPTEWRWIFAFFPVLAAADFNAASTRIALSFTIVLATPTWWHGVSEPGAVRRRTLGTHPPRALSWPSLRQDLPGVTRPVKPRPLNGGIVCQASRATKSRFGWPFSRPCKNFGEKSHLPLRVYFRRSILSPANANDRLTGHTR